jgi:hypothetical protein
MKISILALGFSMALAPAFAGKSCDELKTEIAAKIDAKGVKGYTLDIVAAADVKDQTVVGSCEGGAKKLTYSRDGKAAPAKDAKKAADAPAAK